MIKKIFFIVLDIALKFGQLKFLFRFLKKYKKLFLFLCLLVFAIFLFWLSRFSIYDILESRSTLVTLAQEQAFLSSLVFLLLCALVAITGIPCLSVFGLIGGLMFGFLKGFLLSTVAILLGSCISVLMIRLFFRDFFIKKGGVKLKKMFQRLKKNEVYYLFAFRLFPFTPYALTNIVMGLSTMKIRMFFVISFLTLLPYTLIYNYIGVELSQVNHLQDLSKPSLLIAFSVISFVPIILKYFFDKRSLFSINRTALESKDLVFNEN